MTNRDARNPTSSAADEGAPQTPAGSNGEIRSPEANERRKKKFDELMNEGGPRKHAPREAQKPRSDGTP